MSAKEFHESQRCCCPVPNSTGTLNGGVEVCMTCSYEIRPMTAAEGIAKHYCGQTQPHAAHSWQTPGHLGAFAVASVYQCGGLSAEAKTAEVLADLKALADEWERHFPLIELCDLIAKYETGDQS